MLTRTPAANDKAVQAAKEAVNLVGQGLGNLMYRIYSGDVHKKDPKADWSDDDRKKTSGTKVFLLGGSICTRGYMRTVLPLIAVRQIARIKPALAEEVQTFTPYLSSAHTGAFGAYYLALPETAKAEAAKRAQRISADRKMPIIPLLDIGGTKISLVLAYLGAEGPTFEILQSHLFPTPVGPAKDFYRTLASFIAPPLGRIRQSMIADLVPILAVGQPGRFDDPKGVIGEGTAKDLGPDFPGCNPSTLLGEQLASHGAEIDVYCANDGRCQFLGIGALNRDRERERWSKLQERNEKVAYLGIGTGLGAGYGQIGSDGLVELYGMVNAFDILANDHGDVLHSQFLKEPLLPVPYQYGDLLSGKFFRRFMHQVDLEHDSTGQSMVFLPHSSASDLSLEQKRLLLANPDESVSPLNAVVINTLLEAETISVQTEEIVEAQRPRLEHKLDDTLNTIAAELDQTLLRNVRSSHYDKVIDEVVRTKRRGRRVQFLGIGKCHSIGRDLAYIFSNLGIDSASCELTGADSENLTNIHEDDLVFLISNSGRAAELLQLIPYLRRKHCYTVALVGDPESPIARHCDYVVNTHVTQNPNRVPEAPTTSTTSALAAGTAIGMVVSYLFDYDAETFFLDHPNLQFNVDFPVYGVRADASFDRLAKVEDILRHFATSIRTLTHGGPEFASRVISLTKRILVSHYNRRTVFFTGAGSSLRVAEKIAATLTSIGIDAEAVNPAQLPHGDFAHIRRGDLLVIISFSGRTRHLIHIRDLANNKSVDWAVITSAPDSKLAKSCVPELRLVAGTGVSDKDLVPVPDQKILSSFINLTVGDALAVILAEVVGATTETFATEGHDGGEIGRSRARLGAEFLTRLGLDKARAVAGSPTELKKLNENLPIPIDGGHLEAYVARVTRSGAARSEVLIFGMGAIGLAYLAPLLSERGKTLWFVENNLRRIEAMKNCGFSYSLKSGGQEQVIGRVSVIPDSDHAAILRTALGVDTILTAVGVANVENLLRTLHDIVCLRYQFRIEEPLNILFSENFPVDADPLAAFRHRLREKLDSPDLKVYFDGFIGLVPAIDESQVSEVTPEALSRPIAIESEPATLFVDRRRWCRRAPGTSETLEVDLGEYVKVTDSFLPLHMRKLWAHNMAHAMIGYLGYYAGYRLVCEAVGDDEIESITKSAMKAIGHELYRRWSYRETKQATVGQYIEWRWERYRNPDLNDTIKRLCRDPKRKLSRDDRLVGAANYIRKYATADQRTDGNLVNILVGVAAAIQYAVDTEGEDQYKLRAKVLEDLVGIDSALLSRAEEIFAEFRIRRRQKGMSAGA